MFSRIRVFSPVLALVLLSIASAIALAQQPQNPDPNQSPAVNGQRLQRRGGGRGFRHRPGGKLGPRLMGQLNLTDDQRKQVRAIAEQTLQSHKGEREELRQLGEKRRQGTLTSEEQARAKALHQQMRASRGETEMKIAGILTAEQKAKVEELIKERKANFERFGGPRGRKRGQPDGGDPQKPKPANPTTQP